MANRKTAEAAHNPHSDPVAAATHIFAGNIVALDALGNAVPGTAVAGLVARGVSFEEVDNSTGLAGDKHIQTRSGVFLFDNAAADAITQADVGAFAYISTPTEVCKTAAGKSVAGIVTELIDTQVAVKIEVWPFPVSV